jgi:arginyl-tRNA synthetase
MVQEHIRAIVESVLHEMQLDPGGPVQLDVPRDKRHGDYSTNVALILAKRVGRKPADLARELIDKLAARRDLQAEVSLAGPGFINFKLGETSLAAALGQLLARGADPFPAAAPRGKLQIEFISANPTGPLNVVNARAAAYGNTLAAMLRVAGWEVDREFYVNDAGKQVDLLGASVRARFVQRTGGTAEMPTDGYQGEYVHDLAGLVPEAEGRRWAELEPEAGSRAFGAFAVERVLEWQQRDLERFGVHFDRWFRESELHEGDCVQATLAALEAHGHVYRDAGATFFRTTTWGDEKDRVVVRSGGAPTYFLADAAYHRDKRERGYARVIDVWGPDHHGHIPRMQAVAHALGYEPDWLEIVIIQWVKFVESGKSVKMSKARRADRDARALARCRRTRRREVFLLDAPPQLAPGLRPRSRDRDERRESGVYYVKYAHARICSILARAAEAGLRFGAPDAPRPDALRLDRLASPEEHAVIKLLVDFPSFVERAAMAREPNRLTACTEEIARSFHRFYHEHRVIQEDMELAWARLALCDATRRVLAAALALMGIEAPESMSRDEE